MSKPVITVYTKPFCPFCTRALALFQIKGVTVEQIEAESSQELRAMMVERSGGRNTFPQIFIDGRHIGGSDDLLALESDGQLDKLLN